MSQSFKDLIRNFCLESSFLGLKYFYLYPDLISRCFWAVSLISIFSTALTLTWLLNNRFEEMPTRITIENQYESMHNMPYPSIAICSPNQISISALRHFNTTLVEGNRSINFNDILPKLLGFYEMVDDLDQDSLSQFQALIEANRYNALDIMGMMPQSCDDFLKLCLFKSKKYPNCNVLFHPILTKRGLCCIFNNVYMFKNGKRNEKIKNFQSYTAENSVNFALSVITDYNPDDAVDGTIVNDGAARVMIVESLEFPSEDESNLVRPYSESFHIILPTFTYCSGDVKTLPIKSRKCLFANELYVHNFGEYHSNDCVLLCHVRNIERHCHCTMPYVPYVHVERYCNISSIACINRIKIQSSNSYTKDQCDCLRDCEAYKYSSQLTIGNLKAVPYLTINPYSGVVFNKSSSLLHFYFPSPVYVKKKQETVISLVIFFSNLGGVFGLCIGCSIISIIELFFFIYKAIRNEIEARARVRHLYIN